MSLRSEYPRFEYCCSWGPNEKIGDDFPCALLKGVGESGPTFTKSGPPMMPFLPGVSRIGKRGHSEPRDGVRGSETSVSVLPPFCLPAVNA